MSSDQIHHLCHRIFIGSEDGKRLLELLKKLEMETPIFPQPEDLYPRYGGPLGYATYRSGERNFITKIENMCKQYEQQIEAENKKRKL